ncbi:MAG: hypothetical protein KBC56_04865 [Flavobacterium sp.]|nr:hypothetical protein [Flavobacterium sp.]
MKTILTYYKNSNTSELLFTQEFTETDIKGIPVYFYDKNRKKIEPNDLKGFVKISEKKFNRETKKLKQ